MHNFNVNMNLDDVAFATIADAVAESVMEKVTDKMEDDIKEAVLNDIDVDENISNWMNYNFDIDDYLRHVDFDDYIDKNNDDIEGEARALLENYSPTNACSTGSAFTDAVARAIRYLLLDNDYVDYIVKALERHEKAKMKEEVEASLKEKHFNDFKRELEALKIAEEQAKQNAMNELHNQLTVTNQITNY